MNRGDTENQLAIHDAISEYKEKIERGLFLPEVSFMTSTRLDRKLGGGS